MKLAVFTNFMPAARADARSLDEALSNGPAVSTIAYALASLLRWSTTSGPGVMRGYHGHEDETRQALTDEGWLRTGDLARRGRLGLVEFAGRKKDLIKHGGYSVFAPRSRTCSTSILRSSTARWSASPMNARAGSPAAAVRCRADASISDSELLAWAAERLARYKAPRRIV